MFQYNEIKPLMELSCIRRSLAALFELYTIDIRGLLADQWEFNILIEENNFPNIFFESGKYIMLHDLKKYYGLAYKDVCRKISIQNLLNTLGNHNHLLVSIDPNKWYEKVPLYSPPYHTIVLLDYDKDQNKFVYWDSQNNAFSPQQQLFGLCTPERLIHALTDDIRWSINMENNIHDINNVIVEQFKRVMFRMNYQDKKMVTKGVAYQGICALEQYKEHLVDLINLIKDDKTRKIMVIYQLTRCIQQRELFLKTVSPMLNLDDAANKNYIQKWNYFRLLIAKLDINLSMKTFSEIIEYEKTIKNSLHNYLLEMNH